MDIFSTFSFIQTTRSTINRLNNLSTESIKSFAQTTAISLGYKLAAKKDMKIVDKRIENNYAISNLTTFEYKEQSLKEEEEFSKKLEENISKRRTKDYIQDRKNNVILNEDLKKELGDRKEELEENQDELFGYKLGWSFNKGLNTEDINLLSERDRKKLINRIDEKSGLPVLNEGFTTSDLIYAINKNKVTFLSQTNLNRKNDKPEVFFKGVHDYKNGKEVVDLSKTYTIDRPYSKVFEDKLKGNSVPGSYKFFIEKLHGRNSVTYPYKKNSINNQVEWNGDINMFNRKVFAAFIDNFSDDFSPKFTTYDFIGRSEGVPVYSNTSRRFTLEFTILSDYATQTILAASKLNEKLNSIDLDIDEKVRRVLKEPFVHFGQGYLHNTDRASLFDTPETTWQKISFLAQCCYPHYRADGKMKEQPMVRIRIGDFYDIICYFTSLQFQMNTFDGPMMDLNNSSNDLGEQPMGFKILLTAEVIHDYEPSSDFYGFFHKKKFDSNPDLRINGSGMNLKTDSFRETTTKNSPLSFVSALKNLKDLNFSSLNFESLENNIGKLNDAFNNFKGLNLFEKARNKKLKEIIESKKEIDKELEKIKSKQDLVEVEQDPLVERYNSYLDQEEKDRLQALEEIKKYSSVQEEIDKEMINYVFRDSNLNFDPIDKLKIAQNSEARKVNFLDKVKNFLNS